MVKRFVFGVAGAPPAAPVDLRPFRTTLCTPLDPAAREDGYLVQWFADAGALTRYEVWEAEAPDPAQVVLAEEVIQRGGGWLAARWEQVGRRKWKHVALARRAKGLTLAEMSAGWRGHAGRAATTSGTVQPIPEAARGQAYVQNHPLPRDSGEWRHDAITEVWFDDPHAMQARIEWFRNIAPGDLFSEARFLGVEEVVLG